MTNAVLLGLALFAPAGCKDFNRSTASVKEAVLQGDTTSHVLASGDRDIVLRARAFDRADNRDSARVLYEEAAKQMPQIADWLYLRAAGVTPDSSARAGYFSRLKSQVARDRIRATDAQARERSGDFPGAIKAYSAAGSRLSAIRLRLTPGVSDTDRAQARADLVAYIQHPPGNEEARDAIALFDQLYPRHLPAEDLVLARAASAAGSSSRAAVGYAVAIKAHLGESADFFRYGSALSRLNRDNEAAAQFAKVTAPTSLAAAAGYQRARALIAMGNPGAPAALRSVVSRFPKDTSAAAALLLLSDLATDDGRDDAARSTMLSVVKRFPSSRQAPIARFRAAMIAYIGKNYRASSAEMDSLTARSPQSGEALAATYWAGKSFAQLGETPLAHQRWRAVIAKDPLSYYAVMAAKKLDTAVVAPDRSLMPFPTIPVVDSALDRVAMLKDVGMDTEAEFENSRLYKDASLTPQRLAATAQAFAGTDQAERSIALGRKAIDQAGRTAQNLRLYFPVVAREALITSAKENGLDPIIVASLIRQESQWNPRATSGPGARGLMQLMPSVGKTIAASKGISPWDPSMLYQPAINIRLGTAHLSGLVRRYPNVVRVLAAYNAGESRVAKCVFFYVSEYSEIFTERIPFVETRDYVRIILRNRAYYEALYPW
ncbi:MAG: transglycosylase SLT domain-containing protein [Gemmatimonadota bacterium]|nr:transglycosylase SLT domain-containing protein [Gemmatimonadota bacterium]